jgi:hypothetical protein
MEAVSTSKSSWTSPDHTAQHSTSHETSVHYNACVHMSVLTFPYYAQSDNCIVLTVDRIRVFPVINQPQREVDRLPPPSIEMNRRSFTFDRHVHFHVTALRSASNFLIATPSERKVNQLQNHHGRKSCKFFPQGTLEASGSDTLHWEGRKLARGDFNNNCVVFSTRPAACNITSLCLPLPPPLSLAVRQCIQNERAAGGKAAHIVVFRGVL